MSSGSGSGSGADQHLLALLRAIRLRQAAPDAVAAGIADTAAALTELGLTGEGRPADGGDADAERGSRGAGAGSPPGGGSGFFGGSGAGAGGTPPALPAAEPPAALPPGPARPALPGAVDEHPEGTARPLRPRWASPGAGPSAEGGGPDGDRPATGDSYPEPLRGAGESGGNGPVPGAGTTGSGGGRPAAGAGSAFFGSGPQVRPQGLPPLEPGRPGTPPAAHVEPAPPGAGSFDHRPGTSPTPGAGIPAGSGVPAGSGGFETGSDEVGRPSRNRFAGLPVPQPPAAPPPAGPASGPAPAHPGRADVAPAGGAAVNRGRLPGDALPGRPSWATGDRHGPVGPITPVGGAGTAVPSVPPLPGVQAPRVPGLESPHITPPMVTPTRGASAASAADGMDPADDQLLRDTQRLLSTSLTFAGGPDEVAGRLRAALLQAQPALVDALPGDARTQTGQLARGLTWLVHHLARPPILVDGCARLGAVLAECGVAPGQLQFVGAALAEAMRAGMPAGAWRQDVDVAWRSTWQHAYEWIRHGEAAPGYQPTTWDAVVVEHDLRRPDLAVVRLRPSLPMPFRPGQYARIEVPGLPGVWRPYSLAGAPRRNDLLELHVRAKTQSGVSGTLVHRTAAGDRVRLSRAEGAMGLPPAPGRDLLLIAGDTGVAPLKALLTELADTGDERSAVLFWGVRDLAELYDIEEITEIAHAARRATVVPVVSEGDPGPYASGLVTDAVAAYGEWSDHEVYLAGPPLMLTATGAALRQLGVAPERIHHDAPE